MRLAILILCITFVNQIHALDIRQFPQISPNSFEGGDKLVFLQSVWRHGDRTPTTTFPTDLNKWDRGWGELTLKGMQQHLLLGKRLRDYYTDQLKFTSPSYRADEFFLRSTDVNRTLLSATSNMIAFFKGKAGVDYPTDSEWPTNYVPIPTHTPEQYDFDYVGNPLRHCKRASAIVKLMDECPEVQEIKTKYKDLLDKLSNLTTTKVDIWNVWQVFDAWFIDWDNKRTLPPGFTKELFAKVKELNDRIDDVDYGIGIKPYKDFDIELEMKMLRGGPILWSIIEHMQAKLLCAQTPKNKREKKDARLCKWMDPLKYYAYSAHDITIAGLFAAFDFNDTNFDEPGFPHYSACVTFELWKNPKSEYYVKVLYWVPRNESFKEGDKDVILDLTSSISGCTDKCSLTGFVDRSEKYKPRDDPPKLCNNEVLGSGAAAISIAQGIIYAVGVYTINSFFTKFL